MAWTALQVPLPCSRIRVQTEATRESTHETLAPRRFPKYMTHGKRSTTQAEVICAS